MACGCGKQAGSTSQWTVTPADGSGVKSFSTKPEADVYAARTGGVVRQTAT
jgi:hypothetical protein